MSDASIPKDAARLLERIETYEQLEILLSLHAHPQQEWTADAAAQQLSISAADAESALEHLCALQLCTVTPVGRIRRFRLSDRHASDQALQNLARAYDEQRLAIVRLMNAHAIERLRTAAIRTFADSFLLGRKKKDG